MSEWISVKSSIPPLDEMVIVFCGWVDVAIRRMDERWPSALGFRCIDEDNDPFFHITHWMPLPEPPK